jgi:hypothetical protein
MSSDTDDGIHLRVKGFRAPEGMHGDAVFLDFVDGSFEVLFTNKRQKSNRVVRPPEYSGRQDIVYFSPFGIEFAYCRLQVLSVENGPSILPLSITEFLLQDTGPTSFNFNGLSLQRLRDFGERDAHKDSEEGFPPSIEITAAL